MSGRLLGIDWGLVTGTSILFLILALTHGLLHYNAWIIPNVLIGENRLALCLYALLMLPGTLLHELSHAITAWLLLVKVQELSVSPTVDDGRVLLGFVRHEMTDIFRSIIIGLAPLIVGTCVLLVIGALAFDLTHIHDVLAEGNWPEAIHTLVASLSSGWGWLAVYPIFVVSATMFPSRLDLHGWLAVLTFVLLVFAIAWVVSIGSFLMQWLVEPINVVFQWLMLIFGFALIIDLPILLLFAASTQAVVKQFRSD